MTRPRTAVRTLLGAALLLVATAVPAAPPSFEPRSDVYDVEWSGMTLGRGTITLAPLERGCFRYASATEPVALVRWTYGSPRETSEFCVEDGRIRPRRFEYQNDRRAKDNYTLDFDWSTRTVKTIKGGNVSLRELPGNSFDRFVMQQAVRLWVIDHQADAEPGPGEFTMVDDDRIKTYRFAITGRERIETPAGSFDTIRVERIDNPEKSSRFWVAPERSFVPVKIEHLEDGKVKLRMVLKS